MHSTPEGREPGSARPSTRRIVASGTLLNIGGRVAPLIVALVAIPWTISLVGTARFGALAIVWSLFGYMNVLDLGLGRAVTHTIASEGRGVTGAVTARVRYALLLLVIVGIILGGLLAVISPYLVRFLRAGPDLGAELRTTLLLVAAALPFVVSVNGLRGILEAFQRFDVVNGIHVPTSIFNYISPLIVFLIHPTLGAITLALLVGRVASWAIHLAYVVHLVPELTRGRWTLPNAEVLRPTVSFAGWIAVSNLLSPLMAGLDRYLLAALTSIEAVTYYATPYEAVTRLWILPGSIVPVLFPIFAEHRTEDAGLSVALYGRALKLLAVTLFPVTAIVISFAPGILTVWLGRSLAEATASVLVWLTIGVFVNSLAQLPFSLLQARGRPDITAKLHLLELPFFLVTFVLLVPRYGALGAAITWTLRAAVDAVLLFVSAARELRQEAAMTALWVPTVILPALLLVLLSIIPGGIASHVVLLIAIWGFVAGLWRLGLSSGDRGAAIELASRILRLTGRSGGGST